MTEATGTTTGSGDDACCGSCGTDGTTSQADGTEGVSVVYAVSGMTCGHCASAVTEEISKIDGVHDVRVDLDSGQVTVLGAHRPAEAEVAAAVDEAGYELQGIA